MRITLIHGENVESSYQVLDSLVKTFDRKNINIFNPKSKIPLANNFRSIDLFNETRVYIIEAVETLSDTDTKWLKENYKLLDTEVVLIANRELPISTIKKLPPSDKIYKNDIPIYLWKLLDSLYPGNLTNSLGLLKTTLSSEPVEKIFTLIVGQVKDIYMIKLDNSSLNYPSWRLSKLLQISNKFDLSTLEELIHDLSVIDQKSKQGENLYELLSYSLSKRL